MTELNSPTSIEKGENLTALARPLTRHTSALPDVLYLLSFAPPCPSPFRSPLDFVRHPIVMICIGIPCAIISGVCMPAFDIVLGHWTNQLRGEGVTAQSIEEAGNFAGWLMTVVGVAFVITFATFMACFSMAGAKLSNLLREKYLAAIVIQDQAFFDRIGPGEIVSRASKDINMIRTGLGERLGYLLWSMSIIIASLISAFIAAARVAGVLLALVPFTVIIFTGLGWWTERASRTVDILDGRASSLIEQILSSVRISQSFNMGDRLLLKLENDMLGPLRRMSRKKSAVKAIEFAAAFGAGFLVYCLSFWYGGIAVQDGYPIGNVLTVFYNYVNVFFTFAGVVPHLLASTQAIHAIRNLRLQIERQPPIDVRDTSGLQLDERGPWEPSFELKDVTFAYPSRPTQKALDGLSLHVQPGKFTALVGPSGSGKSTLASLLLRLYDPATASILTDADRKVIKTFQVDGNEAAIDADVLAEEEKRVVGSGSIDFAGKDIRDYNVKWLRSQVAVVLQNPQLVSGTVFDNVAVGLTGTELEYRADIDGAFDASDEKKGKMAMIRERVEEALRKAQAWDFVQELPKGMNTKVAGGRTGVLSGGQVQRVALARALVRRPRCLLLDEATSAVSADTELKIQEALVEEQTSRGMTLIVIAHRLSTIVSADRIYVMVAGQARHYGTYDELMDPECPDQTFRNMALVKQPAHVVKASPTSLATSTRTLSAAPKPTSDEKMPVIPQEERTKPLPPAMTSVKQAFKHNTSLLLIGLACGIIGGAAWVVAAWLFGRGVADFGIPDLSAMRAATNRWSLWFLILTIGTFVVLGFHAFGLELSGERIVSEYRREAVRALMKQDIAYFEGEHTGSGSLTAAAAHHPSNVGNVVGLILGQFISSMTNFIGVIILGFSLNWRLAVMILPALAVASGFGYVNFVCQKIFDKGLNNDIDAQSAFVSESANSIQLLAALTREAETVRQFNLRYTSQPIRSKWLILSGVSLGISMGVLQFFGGLIFFWGSQLLARDQTSIANLFTVIEAVIVAVYVAAKVFTYTGDFARMRNSLDVIQGWLEREPQLAILPPSTPLEPGSFLEGIEFKNVSLRYPSRPDVMALNDVSFRMEPSKAYAFCGTSGAGKSSILAVLQRFYDISSGSVCLDGRDIRTIDPKVLRTEMGYVSQEPILFEETVRWNLVAGAIDPESVTQSQLEWACQQACILDFVKSLPDGFDTDLGLKGGQLSGGQRQRLCIARALIRQPRILLLDEATSALDGRSEAHVQEALDNASRGRLTVTIAHRLSTIRKADTIFVMDQGQIVEIGTHDELVKLNGRYYELVQAQL
ncbi:P-loop containing nucleoside triphosphate hydrolase protein [Dioszegia hungarica]|uniref:P-loop containing nucleoside triphosphate hydrolase protein n=1 Tax=Dioszegia hungarica TaxID=4972 RepID=A0AA38H439_9TREE|nr:P-loop containing nucleoside triphosphate hydrolase protein [Dioszegia hungarica]KAI9632019.1 P-loop containing nucleoside triphosphate hydrolase protein [Dioszegia hungarica]